MATKKAIPYAPITDAQMRPTPEFQDIIEDMYGVVDGFRDFLDVDGRLTADVVSQGVEQKIEEIVNEAISRNADGTISQIVQTSPITNETVATVTVAYSGGRLSEVAVLEADVGGAPLLTTSAFSYSGDLIDSIDLTIGSA